MTLKKSALPNLSLSSRQTEIVAKAVSEYSGADRAFAVRHAALPLYRGWTCTIAICTDGRILAWESDFGEIMSEPVEDIFIRTSLFRAASVHPEMCSLMPRRSDNAATCDMCAGTGIIQYRELPANLICQCGGVGWLDT